MIKKIVKKIPILGRGVRWIWNILHANRRIKALEIKVDLLQCTCIQGKSELEKKSNDVYNDLLGKIEDLQYMQEKIIGQLLLRRREITYEEAAIVRKKISESVFSINGNPAVTENVKARMLQRNLLGRGYEREYELERRIASLEAAISGRRVAQ